MNEIYQAITNAWAAECIYMVGHTLPMNTITEHGCGHAVADSDEPLQLRTGEVARLFTLRYDLGSNPEYEQYAIN